MDAAAFFSALFADAAGPEARLAVWTLPDKKTAWFIEPAKAAEYALSRAGDVYFGVGLYRPGIIRGRGKAADVVGITALWADIDFGPEHKKRGIPPDEKAARDILARVGLMPSLIVHSGHGLQPYWLLKEVATAEEGASRLAERWGATLQAHAATLGYTIDSVWDLSRVLRVPGTWNRKSKPVQARCHPHPDLPRYDLDDFESIYIVEDYSPANPNAIVTVGALTVPTDSQALKVLQRVEQLCREDGRFKNTWERKRRDLASASEYDLSIATQLAAGDWSDQDIAAVLLAWRCKYREQPEKLNRLKYLRDTIGLAKTEYVATKAIEEIKLGVDLPEVGDLKDPRRNTVLDKLSKALRVPVARWIQFGTDNPEYILILADGTRITFSTVRAYRSQQLFGDQILAKRQILPRRVKGAIWDKIVMMLASIVEVEEDPEGGPENEVRGWIERHLRINPPVDNVDDAIEWRRALLRGGRLHVLCDQLLKAVNEIEVPRVSSHQLRSTLRAAGFVSTPVKPDKANLRCTRFWRDDRGLFFEEESNE